jgi:hypothetical protein
LNINDKISTAVNAFKQKIIEFCQKTETEDLSPALYIEFSNCLKTEISELGKNILKEYLLSYDSKEDILEREGKTVRKKFKSSKQFLTFYGDIELNRNLYQHDRGGACYFPLDEKWGVVDEYASPDVQQAILYASALMIPTEVETLFKKCAFFNPSTQAITNMIKSSNQVFAKYEEQIYEHILECERVPESAEIIAASMDGCNVLLREPGKKAGKKNQRPQHVKKNENEVNSCYKNAMVGSISFYEARKNEEKHPRRLESKYLSRMPEEKAITFKSRFEAMLAQTLHKASTLNPEKILLLDGSRTLWNYVKQSSIYKGFKKLIDFYHTAEHLSQAAEAIFGKSNKEADKWYEKHREQLLVDEDGAKNVIRSIKYYKNKFKLPTDRAEELKSELTFFKGNVRKMHYSFFLKKGWPIGSGVVEAACKSVVKTRLCRSGMRWSIPGGQAILNLRSIVKSNRWESFWPLYQDYKQRAA